MDQSVSVTTVAEFKADLNRQRSMEGLTIAREQGRLRGKPPKLDERRTKKLLQEYEAGTATVAQLADDSRSLAQRFSALSIAPRP